MKIANRLAWLQALRAKTVANGCTEAEASAAAAKAAELADNWTEEAANPTEPAPPILTQKRRRWLAASGFYIDNLPYWMETWDEDHR